MLLFLLYIAAVHTVINTTYSSNHNAFRLSIAANRFRCLLPSVLATLLEVLGIYWQIPEAKGGSERDKRKRQTE